MSISDQFSSDPDKKLEYLRKQNHLMQISITAIEDGIKNPPPSISHEKITRTLALEPHIGEYRDHKYHYFTKGELKEKK